MVTLTHLFKGEIIINSLLLVIIMSRPSRGTDTSDGALSASDKEDPLYDEARVDYASSKINADTRDITMMPNVVYEARVQYT